MESADRLVQAAAAGDTEQVARLLRDGVPVDARNSEQPPRTGLDRAVWAGQAEVVRVLLAAGADTGRRMGMNFETMPLHFAAERGLSRIVRLLLNAGAVADIGVAGADSATPLMRAVRAGHEDVAQMLLDHGVRVEPQETRRGSALGSAAQAGRPALVHLLLDAGAVPTTEVLARACRGRDSAELSMRNGSPTGGASARLGEFAEAIAMLRAADPELPSDEDLKAVDRLVQAAAAGDTVQVTVLLRNGVPVDARTVKGSRSALDCAVWAEQTEVVRVLLDAGADTEQLIGEYGETMPLRFAAERELPQIARLLLDAGADPDGAPKGRRGAPLTRAAQTGNTEITRMLLDHGAGAGWPETRSTALVGAAQQGRPATLRLLLGAGAVPTVEALALACEHQAYGKKQIHVGIYPIEWNPQRLEDYAETIAVLEAALAAKKSTTNGAP